MLSAIVSASAPEDRMAQSEKIQAWDFGRKDDPGKEGFPRGFRRRTGPGYPAYQQVRIVPKHPENQANIESTRRSLAQLWLAWKLKKAPWKVVPESIPPWIDLILEQKLLDPCLEMRINGGAIEVQAPPFEIEPAFSYAFDFELQTLELHGFEAYVELAMYDSQRKLIRTVSSPKLTGDNPWRKLEVGPIDILDSNISIGQLKLLVAPLPDPGFKGIARIDHIRVRKMPQLTVELNEESHLYAAGSPVEIRCSASGMIGESPTIQLLLTDHTGQTFANQVLTIEPVEIKKPAQPKSPPAGTRSTLVEKKQGWHGTAVWKLPSLPPGFYKVECKLAHDNPYQLPRQTRFCVFNKDLQGIGDGRFGWSLNDPAGLLPVNEIPKFLQQCAVRNVKLPVWLESTNPTQNKEIAWLIDRLKSSSIDIVGVIDTPPASQRQLFQSKGDLTLASILEQDAVWVTLLEPVLGRICLQVHQIQLGWDDDESLSGNERLAPKVKLFVDQLSLFGPESNLIIPWSGMLQTTGKMAKNPSRFQFFSTPGLTPRELEVLSRAMQKSKQLYWVSIEGLNVRQYSSADCQRHLAESMLTVVEQNIERAWISKPFDIDQGWLDDNGHPGIMLLPFRTLSQAMNNTRYLGRLTLPNGSMAHQLASPDQGSMIVYASAPSTEQIYLGDNVQAYDLYGSPITIENVETEFGVEQVFPVNVSPTLIRGIDADIAQWRMGLHIENPKLKTTASGQETLKVRLSNPTKTRFQGTLSLILPDTLQGGKATGNFNVEPGASEMVEIPLEIRNDATHQKKNARIDIRTKGAKDSRFSVYRELQIGDDDIEILPKAEFDSEGNVRVVIELLNHTGKYSSFDCFLILPDRPRERIQFINSGERSTQVIGLENAKSLQGSTLWLKCEQIGEDRVINKRFTIP